MPFLTRKSHTRESLARDLSAAGVNAGDVLIVHSSLKKVGWIAGGAQEMIRALQETIGPEGTLLMPTFTFSLSGWLLPPFDPWNTASRVGLLTDTFWRCTDVRRTAHPTHSVAAWGRLAAKFTSGPISYEPLGIDSPIDRACRAGAKILLIGVEQNRNSTIHVAEARAGMPYLRVPFTIDDLYDEAWYIDSRGAPAKFLAIREMPGSSEGFEVLDNLLIQKNIATRCVVGDATSTIMSAPRLCDHVMQLLQEDPLLLLDHPNPSEITKRRRAIIEAQLSANHGGAA
ncbi:AAC(3) family N-acetyltransferase [Candidatus Sumerlaeota bacterium]|nr:AAC(3) family N-acetyltransferase [Candidatus Sumerlaeota bacterium]